jgi:hypothetical protein
MRHPWNKVLVAGLLSLGAGACLADEQIFSLHGFGYEDYWKSSANSFNASGDRGTWDNNIFALDVAAVINDRSKVFAQLQTSTFGGTYFTWAFADYNFSDDLRGHAGIIKFPIGIYNEYADTRGLQLSVIQPFVYSKEADMEHNAYEGVGLDYDWHLGNAGKLVVQGYFGNNYDSNSILSANLPFPNQYQQNELLASTSDVRSFGGRATWETPIAGLRFLVTANTTEQETNAGTGTPGGQVGFENRDLLSVDYVTEKLDLKSEIINHHYPAMSGFASLSTRAWYVQAGYLGWERWTPYVRYDNVVTDKARSSDPSFYQHDFLVGTNFKIRDNLNFRIEEHFNRGYALPVASGYTQIGTGKVDWTLLAAEVNYMF